MKYIYKYEDSIRQCETSLTQSIAKLSNYSEYLVQSSSISSPESTERVEEYKIIKTKIGAVQENIATLKSDYNDLTVHSLNPSSCEKFKEKFFNYLACQETLRLKFIEIINECKCINSNLDDILRDCSNEASSKNYIQNASPHSDAASSGPNRAGGGGFDLSSIPKVYVLLQKLDWDNGDPLTSDSHNLETISSSNEHAEEFCTPTAASVSEPLKVSHPDVSSDETAEKYDEKMKNLTSSKQNEAPNLSQSLVCNICHRDFHDTGVLKRHVFLHSGLKPFECTECGKSFARIDSMKRHMIKLHNCIKPKEIPHTYLHRCLSFVCNICGKTFTCQSNLKRHTLIHEGLKPFACAQCGQSFARKYRMDQHTRFRHTPNHTRPYECDICKKRFTKQSNLNYHKRTHFADISNQLALDSYYKCAHCKYRFQSKENLAYHIKRRHISNLSLEEFSCTICGETFSRSYNKRRHERTVHVGGKNFCCTDCGKRYKYDRGLARHLKLGGCKLK